MSLQNKSKRLLILLGSFVFLFISASVFWYTQIDGKLFYCSDKIPLLDLIPPFVHGSQVGDYYIASPVVVYLIWIILIQVIISLPIILLIKKLIKKK